MEAALSMGCGQWGSRGSAGVQGGSLRGVLVVIPRVAGSQLRLG